MPASDARVLVIEDNDALRAMLFTVLRHQPLGVDTASNAEEAMERVRMCDYALILLDMNLPDDDSEEFLRRFRDFRPESTSFVLAVRDPGDVLSIAFRCRRLDALSAARRLGNPAVVIDGRLHWIDHQLRRVSDNIRRGHKVDDGGKRDLPAVRRRDLGAAFFTVGRPRTAA